MKKWIIASILVTLPMMISCSSLQSELYGNQANKPNLPSGTPTYTPDVQIDGTLQRLGDLEERFNDLEERVRHLEEQNIATPTPVPTPSPTSTTTPVKTSAPTPTPVSTPLGTVFTFSGNGDKLSRPFDCPSQGTVTIITQGIGSPQNWLVDVMLLPIEEGVLNHTGAVKIYGGWMHANTVSSYFYVEAGTYALDVDPNGNVVEWTIYISESN